MWKIVLVLLATALCILMARLAYDRPSLDMLVGSAPTVTAAVMYAGIRG